jgi:hypothetical protein
MTSLKLKSRIARLERQMRTEGGGTDADQRLLRRFQAALQREAENRENEARPQREEAA